MRCYRFFKRVFDVVLSLVLSIVFTPLMLVIALLIFLRDGGNPFFLHTRVGQNGKTVRVLKFRTMKKHAEDLAVSLTEQERLEYRREYKLSDDPRLIGYKKKGDGRRCFGALLRRTSMDELPQLWFNVLLLGNMSLVGPRPVLAEELACYYTKEEQALLLSAKPGVTGYWQAYARGSVHYGSGERQKMELYYVKNRSLWLDLKILCRTVAAVFLKIGS